MGEARKKHSRKGDVTEAIADGLATEAFDAIVEAGLNVLAGAVEVASSAGNVAAACAEAAVDAACEIAGSALDGL